MREEDIVKSVFQGWLLYKLNKSSKTGTVEITLCQFFMYLFLICIFCLISAKIILDICHISIISDVCYNIGN